MPELPKTYKAVVYDEPGKTSTKIVDREMPEPGLGEVLINITHSGVCYSDLGIMHDSWPGLPHPTQAGQVGGHEGVGTVVKLGPGAEATTVALGDRVGIKWVASVCFSCAACLSGWDGVCFKQRISGYYTPGTFQQYVLAPANYVTPIPAGLDSAAAAPMLCAGVTVYSALRQSGAGPGQWVALLGAGGGLGHLATQIAARGFGMRVIAVDAGAKRDLARRCGAEHFVDHTAAGGADVEAEVKRLTGGLGAQAVLVLTAANPAYAMAMDLLSFGGTLACVGMPEGQMQAVKGAYPNVLVAKAQRIIGIPVGNRKEAIEVLDMAQRGIVKPHFRTAKMDELTEVFGQMERGELQGRVVLDLSS
ncbi:GroES-like protein [Xylariomycetidae sp. FL0641]|nr:GroES-like protein [Xylariomycetidae sp. FL0641]